MYGMENPADFNLVREDMREDLEAYVQHGRPLDDFLIAVVANSLVDAVARADYTNIRLLPAYASYVHNKMPGNCWGSLEIYNLWLQLHQAVAEKNQQLIDELTVKLNAAKTASRGMRI